MSRGMAIDINCEALAAIGGSDNVVSVFRLDSATPLATCQLPRLLGPIRRIRWAPCGPRFATAVTFVLAVDCESGFSIMDFVNAKYVELRIRNSCPLFTRPHSEWLAFDNSPPALAVTLSILRMTVIWSIEDNVASFPHARGSVPKAGAEGQYVVHWKTGVASKDRLTLWPSMLSCELPVDVPALVAFSPYSSFFAYSDALLGGLYVGVIHSPSLVVLPDVTPIKLQWLRSGSLLCEVGTSGRNQCRRLIIYDEALNELFSFVDATIAPGAIVLQLDINSAKSPHYAEISAAGVPKSVLFDETTDYAMSGCGSYLAIKTSRIISLWDVTSSALPKLLRLFDNTCIPALQIIWAKFDVPWLFAFGHESPYLCIYRCDEDPVILEIGYGATVKQIVVTKFEDVIIWFTDGYQFISNETLWREDASTGSVHQSIIMEENPRSMRFPDPVAYRWLLESTAKCHTLKRSYEDRAASEKLY